MRRLLLLALVFVFPAAAAEQPPTVDEILAYPEDQQALYLADQLPEYIDYYDRHNDELFDLLLGITVQENAASELAMYLFSNRALALSAMSRHPNYVTMAQSEEIDRTLSMLIVGDHVEKTIRRNAILIHARLYPPDAELVEFYVTEIDNATLEKRGLTESILDAFDHYHTSGALPLPSSVKEKLQELVNHNSGGVRRQASVMLERGLE